LATMNKIIIATRNRGKTEEIREILADLNIPISDLNDEGIGIDIDENGESYKENALIKAREIYRLTQRVVISDDSGLEVDALGGRPGIHSARYAEDSKRRIEKLLSEMKGIPFERRRARFRCVACLFINENRYEFFEGTIEGYISEEPKGENGFGFDPVFFLKEYNRTMAEIPIEEKNRISHRARAFHKLREFIIRNRPI
jgi:XTP/dITP diphosphohydrolase